MFPFVPHCRCCQGRFKAFVASTAMASQMISAHSCLARTNFTNADPGRAQSSSALGCRESVQTSEAITVESRELTTLNASKASHWRSGEPDCSNRPADPQFHLNLPLTLDDHLVASSYSSVLAPSFIVAATMISASNLWSIASIAAPSSACFAANLPPHFHSIETLKSLRLLTGTNEVVDDRPGWHLCFY